MKIAIMVRQETLDNCTGNGCLKAFFQRLDAFAEYDRQAELVSFTHAGGDLQRKIDKLKQLGVEVVHLSSCLRGKSPNYAALAEQLAQHFVVVGYSHGPREGRSRVAICLPKSSND